MEMFRVADIRSRESLLFATARQPPEVRRRGADQSIEGRALPGGRVFFPWNRGHPARIIGGLPCFDLRARRLSQHDFGGGRKILGDRVGHLARGRPLASPDQQSLEANTSHGRVRAVFPQMPQQSSCTPGPCHSEPPSPLARFPWYPSTMRRSAPSGSWPGRAARGSVAHAGAAISSASPW